MMNEGELEFCGKIEEQNVSVLLKEEEIGRASCRERV